MNNNLNRAGRNNFFIVSNVEKRTQLLSVILEINGNRFGTLESPTFLPSFIAQLDYLLKIKPIPNLDLELFKSYVIADQDKVFRITYEETFDDFARHVARSENMIFFAFKLTEKPFFCYPNISEELYISTIKIEDFIFALYQFKEFLIKNGNIYPFI